MTDNDFVKLVQQRLAASGLYTGRVDGNVGPLTLGALDKALPPPVFLPRPENFAPVYPVNARPVSDDIPDAGDAKFAGVNSVLVDTIKEASLRCPVPFTVIEGIRTLARQKELVAKGASKTMNSRHLTGHAVDLWPLDANLKALPSGTKQKEAALWAALKTIAGFVKEVAKERGVMLEWGGDWGWDAPHFQLNRKAFP